MGGDLDTKGHLVMSGDIVHTTMHRKALHNISCSYQNINVLWWQNSGLHPGHFSTEGGKSQNQVTWVITSYICYF